MLGRAALMIALLLAGTEPAWAQQPRPQGTDCQRLPGGNAPVQRIARATAPLAVRSLALTYFGMKLADMTEAVFDELTPIYQACNPTDPTAADTIKNFRAVILAAQNNRRETMDWIEKMKFEAGGLPPTRDGIIRLTVMWYEMEQKIPDLLPADAEELSRFLANRMNELYARAPERRAGEDLAPVVRPPASVNVPPALRAVPALPPSAVPQTAP